ncbi:MAG TPA: DUF2933 domain-containing protein [Gemmatimonadales bacterium]
MSGNHLKHMAIGGGVVLATLLLVGVPAGTALTYALLLACPLMMVAMMFMMSGHGGGDSRGPGAPAQTSGREPTQRDRSS